MGVGFYAALLKAVSTAQLWIILALAVVADIVLEEALLAYGGIYLYFGHQPLVLNLFPCWWGFANVSSLFLGASLAFRYKVFFEGWRYIFLALLVPTCYIGAWTFCGMPTISAIQGGFQPVITKDGWIVHLCFCDLTECCHDASRTRTRPLNVEEFFAEEKTVDCQGSDGEILQTLQAFAIRTTARIHMRCGRHGTVQSYA